MRTKIIFLVSFFVIVFFVLIGKKMEGVFTLNDAKVAVLAVKAKYGDLLAKEVERIMRLETAHFTSQQYLHTGSAGMVVGHWVGLNSAFVSGTWKWTDKSGHVFEYYVWRSVTDFALYLAEYITRNGGNYARWNALEPAQQLAYKKQVDSVTTHFV